MKPSFLKHEKPLLTVMLECEIPETAIKRIRNALHCGADAFGLQIETLKREYRNIHTYRSIFTEMQSKPIYVTNYHGRSNIGKTTI